MMPLPSIYRQVSVRQRAWIIGGFWLLVWTLCLSPEIQAQSPVPPAARELSHAFTNAARQALPAVVFITMEKTVETPNAGSFNNPFESFGGSSLSAFSAGEPLRGWGSRHRISLPNWPSSLGMMTLRAWW
jgi:S1-C subfamily serine protease